MILKKYDAYKMHFRGIFQRELGYSICFLVDINRITESESESAGVGGFWVVGVGHPENSGVGVGVGHPEILGTGVG